MSLDIVLELLLSDCFFLGRCTDRSEDCIRFRMSHHLIHTQEDTFDYKWLDKLLSPLKKSSHKIYAMLVNGKVDTNLLAPYYIL